MWSVAAPKSALTEPRVGGGGPLLPREGQGTLVCEGRMWLNTQTSGLPGKTLLVRKFSCSLSPTLPQEQDQDDRRAPVLGGCLPPSSKVLPRTIQESAEPLRRAACWGGGRVRGQQGGSQPRLRLRCRTTGAHHGHNRP